VTGAARGRPFRQNRWVTPDGPTEYVFHVTTPGDWSQALAQGSYRFSTRGRTFEDVRFVHCSYRHQVLEVSELVYPDAAELVLLVLDPGRLASTIRAENPEGGQERFPHLYGPLEPASVVRVLSLRRGSDGRFRLPAGL
jgi:uncharacterized protein (DUF952 family)